MTTASPLERLNVALWSAVMSPERYAKLASSPGQLGLFNEDQHPRGQPENAGEFAATPASPKPPTPKPAVPYQIGTQPETLPNKALRADQDKWLADAAKKLGTDPASVQDHWNRTLKETVGRAKLYIRTPPDILLKILQEGRYKSQFETNVSYGGDLQPEARQDSEWEYMGVPQDIEHRHRPVYGYASNVPPHNQRHEPEAQDSHSGTQGYGRAILELHDHVKDRSTITFGDSLNAADYVRPSPVRSPSWRSLNVEHDDPEGSVHHPVIEHRSVDVQSRWNPKSERTGDYAEVQVHHGLPTSDIAMVHLPKPPGPKTKMALEQAGIPWRVMQ